MDPDAFEEALRRRIENYRSAETKVNTRIRQLEAERQALAERRETAEHLYNAEYGRGPASTATESRAEPARRGPLTGRPWEVAVAEVLGEANAPLHVRDIWAALQAGGFRTDARDPLRSIVAVVLRSGRFVRAGPNTYALVASVEQPGGGDAQASSRR